MPKDNTHFFEKVYHIVRQIPFGKVTTYGAIAKAIGSPQSSRLVGNAMNASHQYTDIPAHRVVNRNGILTGKHHFQGIHLMQELLENEGIQIINDGIVNFKTHFWEPSLLNH